MEEFRLSKIGGKTFAAEIGEELEVLLEKRAWVGALGSGEVAGGLPSYVGLSAIGSAEDLPKGEIFWVSSLSSSKRSRASLKATPGWPEGAVWDRWVREMGDWLEVGDDVSFDGEEEKDVSI